MTRAARTVRWLLVAAGVAAIVAMLHAMWTWRWEGLATYDFVSQDASIACLMIVAVLAFPYLRFPRRFEREIALAPRTLLAGAAALLVVCIAGYWLVMLDYDLSRDQSMATLGAEQIARGTLVTRVPAYWEPFGRAMLPLYFNGAMAPGVAWTSGYLPLNSALQALGGALGHRAIANPLLLVVGLCALWKVARRVWPERRDAAVVALLLAATSSQLLANAMTSFAMVGYFALNTLWLALFLRNDRLGTIGALAVGFVAMGLHHFHFHLMFAAPFLLWLVFRREWALCAIYAVAYGAMVAFWFWGYPAWLVAQAPPEAATAIATRGPRLMAYASSRAGRLFDYVPSVWLLNLVRFIAWQNIAVVPLVAMALALLGSKLGWRDGLLVSLVGSCVIGLVFLVHQGQGFGYRYLCGVIGCFCLLAAYGWIRWVPEPGAGRGWAMIKAACCFTLAIAVPFQFYSSRERIQPYATIYHAAQAADADVVLVDVDDGFLAQDLVQNPPDFAHRPMLMDLSLVPTEALEPLCRSKRVLLIDRRHYRAVGMREIATSPLTRERLRGRRAIMDRLACGAPLPL